MRINITLPDYLVKDTDERAKSLGTSRSAYIASALAHKAQYDDMTKALPKMMDMMAAVTAKAKEQGVFPTACADCANPCKDDKPEETALCEHFRPLRK